ncbi:MAG: alpha/beta hydrolase [Eubacteriales bacterium]|nr:alpha/beta hydrolase [Eubacteriales bacterium]
MGPVLTAVLIALGAILVLGVFPTMLFSFGIYTVLLVRNKPEKWQRGCSFPEDEEYVRMYEKGLAWNAVYKERMRPVSVTSDGLKLQGEYFDFGSDKAVIIVAGRTETVPYAYFFAEPYRKAGYNVLAIDNRAHGLSEGKRSSLGFKEWRDLLAWGRLLHDELGVRAVVLHGICIGASASLFALTDPSCPDYFAGLVAEGMYARFYDSFNNHMIEDKHPIFPFSIETMLWIRLLSGAKPVTDGPLRRMEKLTRPALFLHSHEDTFSTPERSAEVYAKCTSPHELVWFDKGAHSRIRINNTEAHDQAVTGFLEKYIH